MSKAYYCSIVCMLLSTWATVQLFLMGIFYHIGAVTLIHDVHAHGASDPKQFVKETKENYKSVAFNCWVCACIYLLFILISWNYMNSAKKKLAASGEPLSEDDELYCDRLTEKELKF